MRVDVVGRVDVALVKLGVAGRLAVAGGVAIALVGVDVAGGVVVVKRAHVLDGLVGGRVDVVGRDSVA